MQSATTSLLKAELPDDALTAWHTAEPKETGAFPDDRRSYSDFWRLSQKLIEYLPEKPARSERQGRVAETIHRTTRDTRERFLRKHIESVYAQLTQNLYRFVRLETLVFAAADAFPGLAPTQQQVAAEASLLQRDKDGLEIDQGILLAHILGHERSGLHLCHAMLLPRAETEEHLATFRAEGTVDLGAVRLERRGKAAHLLMRNPR